MRGEETPPSCSTRANMEIPPHARRRVSEVCRKLAPDGNTSACAEKRDVFGDEWFPLGKYLRMRGEEDGLASFQASRSEIPPHARRRVYLRFPYFRRAGNTSACAEKRENDAVALVAWRKYLRMRGEESPMTVRITAASEIPPHARRRDWPVALTTALRWKNLRMRGEEFVNRLAGNRPREIPPHARRRAGDGLHLDEDRGNTSACAEKRYPLAARSAHPGKYLRMRGEERSPALEKPQIWEIPPHARRRAVRG